MRLRAVLERYMQWLQEKQKLLSAQRNRIVESVSRQRQNCALTVHLLRDLLPDIVRTGFAVGFCLVGVAAVYQ
ncbi:MAG: hypothetical protein ACMZ63_07770 [Methylotenera sp.]